MQKIGSGEGYRETAAVEAGSPATSAAAVTTDVPFTRFISPRSAYTRSGFGLVVAVDTRDAGLTPVSTATLFAAFSAEIAVRSFVNSGKGEIGSIARPMRIAFSAGQQRQRGSRYAVISTTAGRMRGHVGNHEGDGAQSAQQQPETMLQG
jgi:hypothetical protein